MITYLLGDCREKLKELPAESVDACITSPPYFRQRSYGMGAAQGELGCEKTVEEYVENLVETFREVRRVLKPEATAWVNLGDVYLANKQLGGLPWRFAFAMQDDGWILRTDVIWSKTFCLPESVKDRPTRSHEYIFLMGKQAAYHYDADAIREPHSEESLARVKRGRSDSHKWVKGPGGQTLARDISRACHPKGKNKRTVWSAPVSSFGGAHFAGFSPDLIRPCVLAGCPRDGTIVDPFGGSGTTALVAEQEGRNCILVELNPAYLELAKQRTQQASLLAA